MSYHIRVRPTALVIQDERILLVEYSDANGIHYNLPGGGAEPGESITDGVLRELYEETYAPHHHSGNQTSNIHTLYIVLECYP
ncbi:NUDIX domain-containing protein [Paenibacillus ihbetae]|uniref:NUDIX domain-containing protein n=1 Tax=Paenibacillus ihbetae TaxID=1870820 RepID=UPI0026A02623